MNSAEAPLSLEGSWQMVRAELDGESAPELVAQRTLLRFYRGSYQVSFDGAVIDEGTCERSVDGQNRLTLRGNSGPNSGSTITAIFQQAGQRLRICFGLDGVMPTAFSTAIGSNRYLATYRLVP